MPDTPRGLGGLVAVLVGEVRAVARGLLVVVLLGLASWPFGGPFHALHAAFGLITHVISVLAAWTGAPTHR